MVYHPGRDGKRPPHAKWQSRIDHRIGPLMRKKIMLAAFCAFAVLFMTYCQNKNLATDAGGMEHGVQPIIMDWDISRAKTAISEEDIQGQQLQEVTLSEGRQKFGPRWAKITLASGMDDVLSDRGLETHVRHAQRHGYSMYVGRVNAIKGPFDKVGYVMHILLSEMYKPPEQRAEWVFWFDADTMVTNPQIPLEIFEPPPDYRHINFLASKDTNGLNAGVFMMRVCPWSLDLLTNVMTYRHYHANETYRFGEQTVLRRLLDHDDRFTNHTIYMPRKWFNTYLHIDDMEPGAFLGHFPGDVIYLKWIMFKWLRTVDVDASKYSRPVDDTFYDAEIRTFWTAKRRADDVLRGFDRDSRRGGDPVQIAAGHDWAKTLADDFDTRCNALRHAARYMTDEPDTLMNLVNETKKKYGELVDQLMQVLQMKVLWAG